MKGKYFIADQEDIDKKLASDVYFSRTIPFVEQNDGKAITAEITASSDEIINFTGVQEILNLLEGKNISLRTLPEGTVIRSRDSAGIPIPFVIIEGIYESIMEYETSLLGFICQSSGISTQSSKFFQEIYPKEFVSFGIRRMHPAISPMIDRAAFIGGASGVSGILGGELTDTIPVGTMPHSIAIIMGEEKAWEYVYNNSPKGKRTLLIDTFGDEKIKALEIAEKFPETDYIRLDTHSTRRGNFASIVREVRWELDLRGHSRIKIMVSGGLKLDQISELKKAGAELFGVGTSIASAKPIDFAMDIVQVEKKPISKKGKYSGSKDVLKCRECDNVRVVPKGIPLQCHGPMKSVMVEVLHEGKKVMKPETAKEIRARSVEMSLKLIQARIE